jgi:3-polyprenyl-4-hydroxybenzoate decarboxylase
MKKLLNQRVIYVVPTGAHKTKYLEELLVKPLIELGAEAWIIPSDMGKSIIPEYEKFRLQYNVKDNFSNQKSWIIPEEELVVVAPCTFNTFNKIANGIADNYALSIIHSAI